MTIGGMEFLALVIGALTLFAGVLAWACWMEGREKKRAAITAKIAESHSQLGKPTRRAF